MYQGMEIKTVFYIICTSFTLFSYMFETFEGIRVRSFPFCNEYYSDTQSIRRNALSGPFVPRIMDYRSVQISHNLFISLNLLSNKNYAQKST